jgi:hypothetical protein
MSGRAVRLAAGLSRPFRSPTAVPDLRGTSGPETDPLPQVEFVAYAEDCVVSGRVHLSADRLSDVVNGNEALHVADARVESLADGRELELDELVVNRDEILLVHAWGSRGRPDRRSRTRQHPIIAKLGPYQVSGYLHVLPGADPISSIRRRRAFVALTEGVIEFSFGDRVVRRQAETVLINRALADWIVERQDEDQLANFAIPTGESGPLLKDFTGDVMDRLTTPSTTDDPAPSEADPIQLPRTA